MNNNEKQEPQKEFAPAEFRIVSLPTDPEERKKKIAKLVQKRNAIFKELGLPIPNTNKNEEGDSLRQR